MRCIRGDHPHGSPRLVGADDEHLVEVVLGETWSIHEGERVACAGHASSSLPFAAPRLPVEKGREVRRSAEHFYLANLVEEGGKHVMRPSL